MDLMNMVVKVECGGSYCGYKRSMLALKGPSRWQLVGYRCWCAIRSPTSGYVRQCQRSIPGIGYLLTREPCHREQVAHREWTIERLKKAFGSTVNVKESSSRIFMYYDDNKALQSDHDLDTDWSSSRDALLAHPMPTNDFFEYAT